MHDSTSDRILHLSGLELNRLMCASDDARSLVIDESCRWIKWPCSCRWSHVRPEAVRKAAAGIMMWGKLPKERITRYK
jgi:hypothetical protein